MEKPDIEKIKQEKSINELLEFGILVIDKPSGPTSFNVSDTVRKILGLKKTSHFGTLDPKVTGVLPIAMNRACKLTGFFLGEDKEYTGTMRLHEDVSEERLKTAIEERFTGKIMQKPPVKSRVARVLREREIKSFDITGREGKDRDFHVVCQGGTYIRKLIDDLGKDLGIGAHMLKLRRTRAGIFKEKDSVSLDGLEKAATKYKDGDDGMLKGMIFPAEVISELFPVAQIRSDEEKILHGQPIYEDNLAYRGDYMNGEKISVFSGKRFIGIFKVVREGRVFARPEFVLQPIEGKEDFKTKDSSL